MSKLPVVAARDVIRVAERLGFALDRQREGKVTWRIDDDCSS